MSKIVYLILVFNISTIYGFSDVGKWDLPLSGEACDFTIEKSLFKGSKLIAALHCDVNKPTNVTITYQWFQTRCSPDYLHYFEKKIVNCRSSEGRDPRKITLLDRIRNDTLLFSAQETHTCTSKNTIFFNNNAKTNQNAQTIQADIDVQSKIPPLLAVAAEGSYMLRMSVLSGADFAGTFRVELVSPRGYLSAAIWPHLPFFGIMCAVYTALCTLWLLVCGLQWRDLLRIQYWIGAVALMGMVESATYYGVYSSINRTGYFNVGAYVFAEWVSIAKRALARMLVIIVSLGYGIVKPRLGPALQRVVGAGALWGALGGIEAWLRLHHKAADSNRDLLLSAAPLALLDAAISWWVFVSLAHTMRTLQLRRNAIKLSLYRHFTNTLVFAVAASVVYMLYSVKRYRVDPCIAEWKVLWMDEAYWHILFACLLGVIMLLWRPTNNNQRYAFTPLLDTADDDDDEEEQFVNDAYGVKMRGTGGAGHEAAGGAPDPRHDSHPDPRSNSLEADLQWVEENIPTCSLPLLDSDEEIINTKFEVSKMQ